ncbi:hypothetical protein DPMN_151768 [Dreissena polymorpha]|uniref:Uncharacterized protein n=1 Tax=Dreissena polymorpha TaxID=45954 RepID=A0A9D4FH48_DREPO|nr:hypothetical protein DPMN_151768 [Dreissena polymorpha]
MKLSKRNLPSNNSFLPIGTSNNVVQPHCFHASEYYIETFTQLTIFLLKVIDVLILSHYLITLVQGCFFTSP